MPTLVLRRHVSFAARLLSERPGDRSARLPAVKAEFMATAGGFSRRRRRFG